MSRLQVSIILLALSTAVIHIVLAIPTKLVIFYLNGLGYLVLVTALYLPLFQRWHRFIRWILIGYTMLTVALWIRSGERSLIGYSDKLIEIALMSLLWIEVRQSKA